jgi:hypothetical protein
MNVKFSASNECIKDEFNEYVIKRQARNLFKNSFNFCHNAVICCCSCLISYLQLN